ncbi:MAG: copper oxidase [Planctomycetota bacterium]|nr:copper oxidase [Planctomycetota bacterium]
MNAESKKTPSTSIESSKLTRRSMLAGSAIALASAPSLLARFGNLQAAEVPASAPASTPQTGLGYTPVVTPNGSTLPYEMDGNTKVFKLVAEPVQREFAPGMVVQCWGYNGQTPGPTIEAVEGDRVRILVTNKLPEATTVHWHGIIAANGMDGVAGLTQPAIAPGETWAYEFVLNQNGTQMYHPHSDEMVQMALGMFGFFIIHPKQPPSPKVDRDFCIFLQEWFVPPGTSRPNPMIMLDFNIFTFNGRVWPGTAPLVVRQGDRVRIRYGNLSMDDHPIHLHGHRLMVTGTDAGPIAPSAQWPETTINVPVGSTRTVEFIADNPGDWPLHCHKNHHAMNAMSHDVPNLIGVDQQKSEDLISRLVPGYMSMGASGMSDMTEMQMPLPKNTLPMMYGSGPFGSIAMGGMFTLLKVRPDLKTYDDPGWYEQPTGTKAWRVGKT